ncbi:hypothetical protein [Shewanella algidipiscicola]|uniref:Lipoprotein n=1 Tax=Shewanella algidipiscicola TaxID=614070 RepID=A0ABQ4PKU2_9GAMM|nr:hypothetical protein [Shewanella algidipiscicola]GIU47847.1 hypothetical protein TUM4630_22780 [Shewanella algidipiscicola]
MKAIIILAALINISGCAELKDTGRTIGDTTRDVTTEIGHTTRDVTRAIGHASRDAVISVKEDLSKED